MCKYCEIENAGYQAKRKMKNKKEITVQIIKHMSLDNFYYLKIWTQAQNAVIDIKYCPMCRQKVR